jgi:hypothetical protein
MADDARIQAAIGDAERFLNAWHGRPMRERLWEIADAPRCRRRPASGRRDVARPPSLTDAMARNERQPLRPPKPSSPAIENAAAGRTFLSPSDRIAFP